MHPQDHQTKANEKCTKYSLLPDRIPWGALVTILHPFSSTRVRHDGGLGAVSYRKANISSAC